MTPDEWVESKKMSKCRGCGADIYWITTKKGKHVPCDPREHAVYEGGKDIFFTEDGSVIKGIADRSKGGGFLGFGRTSHWATCPNANSFRRK